MERDRIRQGGSGRRGAVPANRRGPRGPRTVRRNRALALAILAVLGLAAAVFAGQASGSARSAERAQQKALRAAERTAEREAKRLQRRTSHENEAANKRAQREAVKHAGEQGATIATHHALVTIECNQIVVQYKEFPETGLNLAGEKMTFRQAKPSPSWTSPIDDYSFTGTTAEHVIPIAAPLGQSTVVFRARFLSNGVHGSAAAHVRLFCGPLPGFTLSTEQSLGGPFTGSTQAGTVGQAVFYQTVATNTGNTPLTFSGFSAPGCDHTAAGGSKSSIEPHGATVFDCSHVLKPADAAAGFFANAASVTGTPGSGEGSPITHVSGGVLVSPVLPGTVEPEVTTPAHAAGGGAPSSSATPSNTKSGELSFSSARIPSLLGPGKCVRSIFTVSVKSAGVASVVFYLDGHRLTRRTVHSAVKGLISLRIDGSKLTPGIHHLRALITMKPGSPTAKAVVAARARLVRRCSLAKTAH
jgi:hypothetical protein